MVVRHGVGEHKVEVPHKLLPVTVFPAIAIVLLLSTVFSAFLAVFSLLTRRRRVVELLVDLGLNGGEVHGSLDDRVVPGGLFLGHRECEEPVLVDLSEPAEDVVVKPLLGCLRAPPKGLVQELQMLVFDVLTFLHTKRVVYLSFFG